jgi:hypothetical protein
MEHWIKDDAQRERFWSTAKKDYDLNEGLVHYGLDVGSVGDFKGSIDDALMILRGFSRGVAKSLEEVAEAARQTAEAPLLTWTEVALPSGRTYTISYRECGLSANARAMALRNTKAAIMDIERLADEIGMVNVTAPPPDEQEEGPVYVPIADEQGTVEHIDYLKVTAPQGKPVIELWRDNRKWPELKWYLGGDAFLKACPELQRQLTPQQLNTPSAVEYRVLLEAVWKPSPKNPKWHDIVAVRIRDA